MARSFPDQPYLDRIRAALWQRGPHGSATVMVGAGMSLNASPRGLGSGQFPKWRDLARTIVDHLYPTQGGADSEHRAQALRQTEATSGFLRVAQEYEIAFGRGALERLIGDAVPDLRFEPSDLHQRLLALPWADVFTTNWDTLLERAATRVVDRHYDLVRKAADIPGSARPRIVKLHGTLPAIGRLIFTEEDFRTYPVRFAPFVNLAQQSMMESVYCLLGFSGDDPNFLYWSGWVRDHLRDYAHRIYLVGWLDLPPPRRRMLENRGVVPIDLAHLPWDPAWPEEAREKRALEWFLSSMEEAEPYRETDWPEPRDQRGRKRPEYFPPAQASDTGAPRREPASPAHPGNLEEIRSVVEVWRHNRRLYPGWIIAPQSARFRLWWDTLEWIPATIKALSDMSPVERIEMLEELNWRLETCLVPLTPDLVSAISEALSQVDLPSAPETLPASNGLGRDQRRQWVTLAAALLRAAREADDPAAFQRWAEALTPHRLNHTWLPPKIAYERCLLALAGLDHAGVERALDDLDTDVDEVFWKVRKAGILAELGKTEDSFRLAGEALPDIRQQLGNRGTDIATLSREGWAMMLAEGFSFYPHARDVEGDKVVPDRSDRGLEPRERAARRWEVLRKYGCDAREEFYEVRRSLDHPPSPQPEVVEKHGFDPWDRTRWRRYSRGGWEHLPALQAKRLVEEAGIPPLVDQVDLAKTVLLRAAVWLAEPAPSLALGAILRASNYEKDPTFDEFLNRSRVALLTEPQVETIIERVWRALDYGLPRAAAAMSEGNYERETYWVGRVRVAIEVLSRLALRLDGDRAERVLDRALAYYRLPIFREHHWLTEPLAHLFSRTLRALDPERIRARLSQFLDLPLPNEGDFRTDNDSDWPDPFFLAAEFLGDGHPGKVDAPEWDEAIDRMIVSAGRAPSLYPRWPAINRLEVLLRWGILTEQQELRFGEALWRHRTSPTQFPEGTLFYDFTFLEVPCPEPGLAEQLFRSKYLASAKNPEEPVVPQRLFRNLLGVTEARQKGKTRFTLSSAEIEGVVERMLIGWRSGKLRLAVENPHGWGSLFERDSYRMSYARALGRVVLPGLDRASPNIGFVVEMINELRSLGFPVESTYPALTVLCPDLLHEVSDRMRQSLASAERERAEAAVLAVWWWLRDGSKVGLGQPASDLVREVAVAVSMRRPSLQQALVAAEWILRNGAPGEADRFARLVGEGLGYLLSEATYEAGLMPQPSAGFRPNEIAEVRILCVKVAFALDQAGFGGIPSAVEWIRQARVDPFPEVRRALGVGDRALPPNSVVEPAALPARTNG